MQYYPIFARVAGWPCLVIGGGAVAERKVITLLDAGARVTVVSPSLTTALAALAAARQIVHHPRLYRSGDLHGFRLAFAATDDEALHATIAREAEAEAVLLNVVDRPQFCSFIVPAIVRQGDLTIAISTGGASPALAKRIREELAEQYGHEYARALAILGAVRHRLQAESRTPSERQEILTALVHSGLLEYLRTGQTAEVDQLLSVVIGNRTSVSELGVPLD